MFPVLGRFANASTEAANAAEVVRSQREEERRYRRMLRLTDGLLGRLEVRNVRGGGHVTERLRKDIVRTLDQVSPAARARFPGCDTVQQAVDGLFEVQDELLRVRQRLMRWNRVWEEAGELDGLIRQTA